MYQAMDSVRYPCAAFSHSSAIEVDVTGLTLESSITIADLPVIEGVIYLGEPGRDRVHDDHDARRGRRRGRDRGRGHGARGPRQGRRGRRRRRSTTQTSRTVIRSLHVVRSATGKRSRKHADPLGGRRCLWSRIDAFAPQLGLQRLLQELHGVYGDAVDAQFPVQMRAGAEAGIADKADRFSTADRLARLDERFVQVPIAGEDAASVVEQDGIAAHVERLRSGRR